MQRTPVRGRPAGRTTKRSASGAAARSASAPEPKSGQLLFDRYRLEERVGRGGMADVWRAHDERLDRTVAVKVLHPRLLPDESWRRRFVAEARAASGLSHPGIVPVYDVIDDPNLPAIVFQYVEGESLAVRLRRDGSVPVQQATSIATQVAEALDLAHRAGLVHRDVKPANILLDRRDGRARLVDFGIARVVDDAQAELTGAHEVLGTLRYMAPEQLAGKPADARTDLYALGLVIGEMIPDLEAAPDWLRVIVGRLRAPDPADRPASAADVERALATGDLPERGGEAEPEAIPTPGFDARPADTEARDANALDAPTVSLAAMDARRTAEAAPVATATAVVAAPAPFVAAPASFVATPASEAAKPAPPNRATPKSAEPVRTTAPGVPRNRAARRMDLRPLAIAVIVVGVIVGGVALAGNDRGALGGSAPDAAATPAPLATPASTIPGVGPQKTHGKGHGRGGG
jgi:hypothetical protein